MRFLHTLHSTAVIVAALGLVPATLGQTAATRGEARHRNSWVDAKTGLMWATADNGYGVGWTRASNYCRDLAVGGYKDWTLPSIDDLQQLFGGPANASGRHVAGPIQITGWAWSASPGLEPGEQWAFDFGDGGRASVVMGDSGLNRALCVRHPRQ